MATSGCRLTSTIGKSDGICPTEPEKAKLVKLATAANTIVNTGTATTVKAQINTAGVGAGKFRIRLWATLLAAPSGTPV